MSALSILPYLRPIAVTSNGIFAGLGISVTLAAVPTLRYSGYPVSGFMTLYDRGKNIAVGTILVSCLSQSAIYYFTKDPRALYCAILSATNVLWTRGCMWPTITRLRELHEGSPTRHTGEAKQLIEKWGRLQYYRTAVGMLAFLLSVF